MELRPRKKRETKLKIIIQKKNIEFYLFFTYDQPKCQNIFIGIGELF